MQVVRFHDWFAARIPEEWRTEGLEVVDDQDEILVVVHVGDHQQESDALRVFRDATRDERMAVALEAEAAFGRKVSWGVRAGPQLVLFTTTSVPVMTRLRLPERRTLDTLIDAGIARTRSEALAWCVRLVADNEQQWISELRAAFEHVEAVRDQGPGSRRPRSG
jgi:hypothetical protein